MIEKKIYRTAHIYITAFHAHFVRRQCRVRRECRHSAEWRQCAERCATEIKVGHLEGEQKYINLGGHYFKNKQLLWLPNEALTQWGLLLLEITLFLFKGEIFFLQKNPTNSLHKTFSTDAGQLSDSLKSFAGQNKYLLDCRQLCCRNIIFFSKIHRTFVRQTFCRAKWKFTSFVLQSCTFPEGCPKA